MDGIAEVCSDRVPNSSRKNIPLPCGISSMPSSASTPSIHGVSWRSPFEVARLGESGLDYANTEKKYTVSAYPGESFSGLQLMCLMYAGFKRIAPDRDTGMDLNEPWITALGLFNIGNRVKNQDSYTKAFALGEELPPECKLDSRWFLKNLNRYPAKTLARRQSRCSPAGRKVTPSTYGLANSPPNSDSGFHCERIR